MRRWSIGSILIIVFFIYNPKIIQAIDITNYPAEGIKITPAQGPVSMQTVEIEVTGNKRALPKIVWVQEDTGLWRATFSAGPKTTDTAYDSSRKKYPAKKRTDFVLDMRPYAPEVMKDKSNNPYPPSLLSIQQSLEITDMSWASPSSSYEKHTPKPEYRQGSLIANISVSTGYPLEATKWEPYTPNGVTPVKYKADYYIPMDVYFKAKIVEKKQMRVQQSTNLQVNGTTNLRAQVRTKTVDMPALGNNWVDVTTRSDVQWKSDNSAVASVDGQGRVTAHAQGTARITAIWRPSAIGPNQGNNRDNPYHLYGVATISVGRASQPDVNCTVPAPGQRHTGAYLDPGVSAVIRADQRGSEQFDVLQGIPSSENLYGHVFAQEYLFQNQFVEMSGTCTYKIEVEKKYTLKWDPQKDVPDGNGGTRIETDPQSKEVTKVYKYDIVRPYSYWVIDQLDIYELGQAVLENDALPGGEITLFPNDYDAPQFTADATGQFIPPETPDKIDAPAGVKDGGVSSSPPEPDDDTEALRPMAEEAAKPIDVQNDSLEFEGQTIMDGSQIEEKGPAPGTLPPPQPIGDQVLYSPGNQIEPTHRNAQALPSSGEIQYALMDGSINSTSQEQRFPINGINPVTVHTPVVNYSVLPDDNRPFDQRMIPDMSRTVLILDRPFTVIFTEDGQHLNIPGYGYRDYAKYTMNKRIQFPFGVFQSGQYYPEGTWIDIPVGTPSMVFQMPTWVEEGNYTIHTQAWAINSMPGDNCEVHINGNLNNYCASESFNVGVVGRLFGFRIWDIGDFRYEQVFRTAQGSMEHSTAMYYAGGNDENGNPTSISGQKQWFLPIRKGSHPAEQVTVPHNGYSFLFDFKTIGNVWDKGDGIRIEPSFWYVPLGGGTPAPVDLYYDISGSSSKMIGVGSPKDKQSYLRTYRLADPLRNISNGELSTAASYEYNYVLSDGERERQSWSSFYKKYLKRKTAIGTGYDLEILPFKSRTLIGPTAIPNEVNPITAVRSVQHWYGEYHLPIAPYLLPKGTNIVALANQYGGSLDGHETEFMKEGYILVKFGIYTLRNGDVENRVLGYKAPITDMWNIEGRINGDTDEKGNVFSFSSGDIMLFESDYSVRNDYLGQGK
jgi:hypothetical protein